MIQLTGAYSLLKTLIGFYISVLHFTLEALLSLESALPIGIFWPVRRQTTGRGIPPLWGTSALTRTGDQR